MDQIYMIFDKAGKRCISLSKRSTIRVINGLYGKTYPLDSQVDYHWTEHEDDDLRKTLADTIITINGADSYHMELQMYPDNEIALRVFEYGYRHALVNRDGKDVLIFPNPKIVYLFEDGDAPDCHELTIRFGEQGEFVYRVPTLKYQKMPVEELNRLGLIVLIPFQLLRLCKAIEKERTPENLEALKNLVTHDILDSIRQNIAIGNLTPMEGEALKRITWQLYRYIYEKYEELGEAGIHEMVEEAMILDLDYIEAEHRKEIKSIIREKDDVIQEKDDVIQELTMKLRGLGVPEAEIQAIISGTV